VTYLIVIIVYALVLMLVGLFVSRRVRTTSEFFVAGRSLSPPLIFATLLAANIGGGSTVGAAGLGYQFGLSAWWWVGAAGIGQLLLAFTIGPRIWQRAKRHGFYTLGDFLENRYSRNVRGTAAVLIWAGSLAILAGQLIGVAWILNVVTGVAKPVGCLIGGLCVTLYFSLGGLRSAAQVNVVQLIVKLAGFGLAFPLALGAVGGWGALRAQLETTPASTGFVGITGIGLTGILNYLVLLVPPFIVSPGLLQKIYGARDEQAVRWGTACNGIVMLCFSFAPVIMGMVAAVSFPGLGNRELALPWVMLRLLPVWIGALALAAVFSAELSAADAVLFMLSTSLSKDLYKEFIRPQATEKQLFLVSRLTSIVAGTLSVVLAMMLPSIISALSIFYGLVTVSLFVPVVAGILSNRPTAATAMVSLALAVPGTIVIHLATQGQGLGILSPVGFGLLLSLLAFVPSIIHPRNLRNS
jgi:solute:Na+ symporter, SSS family